MLIKKEFDKNSLSAIPMPHLNKVYDGKDISISLNDSPWNTYKIAFLDDYRFEYEHSYTIKELKEWIALEQFFGVRISKQTYEDLSTFYNSNHVPDDDDKPVGKSRSKGNGSDEKIRTHADEYTYVMQLGGKSPCMTAFRAGDKVICTTDNGNKDAGQGSKSGIVTGILQSAEANLKETGPTYCIRLRDNTELCMRYDELEGNNSNAQ